MKVCVLIPAYNEAATIRDIARRVLNQKLPLVVVDDGSSDATSEQLRGLDLTLLRNEENCGKAASLWRGMRWALERGMDAVITLDGDSQHRPEDIPRFVEAAGEHPERIIIGSRLHDKDKIPASRYRANRFANFWVAWASGYPIEDSQTGFRLYPASLLRELELDTGREKGFVFESEILIEAGWRGMRTFPLSIPAIYSAGLRESHFHGVADIAKITRMIAWRIISRGFYPLGLYRSSIQPALQRGAMRGIDRDASWMLLFSLLIGVLSLGLSHLWILFRVILQAAQTGTVARRGDVIMVLGHALDRGQLSPDYRARLERVRLLLRQFPQARVLILGGRPQSGLSEARAGREYLVAKGISSDWIHCEEQSSNTLENLVNARDRLAEFKHPVLVSNRYHLRRVGVFAAVIDMPVRLIAAEDRFRLVANLGKILIETFYLHWYLSGRFFARLTKNRNMLDKTGDNFHDKKEQADK